VSVATLVIVVGAAAGIGIGAYAIGHAVDKPAEQLGAVLSEPAQAATATAESNLSPAVAAAAAYGADHGTYSGMTTSSLRSYDRAIASSVSVRQASAGAYCLESTVAGVTVSIRGPNGAFVERRC